MTMSRAAVLAPLVCLAAAAVACGGSNPPPPTAGGNAGAADSVATSGNGTPPPADSSPVGSLPNTPEKQAGSDAFDKGDYAGARKAFEAAAKKNPKDYEALYNLGMTCEKLGDRAAAEAAYKQAVAIKPDFDTAAAELSSMLADDGRIDDALAVARTALAKHAGSAPLHEALGNALAARGDQDAAIKEFDQAIQIQPGESLYHLAVAHWLNAWKTKGAAAHLEAALPLAKGDLGMVASIGHEYRMAAGAQGCDATCQSGMFDSCTKTFDKAVGIRDGGEVRTERALCKLGLKDEKGALDDLKAAVSKEPGYAPAHYYLGGRLAMAHMFKDAAAEYAKYLELEPNGSMAKAANDRMKAAQEAASGDKDKGNKPKKK